MRLEELGLVGNCQFAAHVERTGSVVWACLPRFDSEPMFGALLDEREGGRFTIAPPEGEPGVQEYLENTNVLSTTFETKTGRFRVLDFAPRFPQVEGMFHPAQLHRVIEPLAGTPHVRVDLDPRLGWSKQVPGFVPGGQHVRLEGFSNPVWFGSDIPAADVLERRPFPLTERKHLVLSWDTPVTEPLGPTSERMLDATVRYWQRWVKHCNIPPLWQRETIRSALTLKLHCYEDTGAIVAATTTSIPESPGSGRTWDYRYCWLRDSYYVLSALRLVGHFEERARFVRFLLDLVGDANDLSLAPLYRVDGTSNLDEHIIGGWSGYAGEGPVRVGNGAAVHTQNDVFGEMVLALSPLYLDERFADERSPAALALLERLTDRACAVVGAPDAGIWEYRTEWKPQTFSSLMCWAAADRMAAISTRHATGKRDKFERAAGDIRNLIAAEAWDPSLGSFVGAHGGHDLDAALLQMAPLRFLGPNDPKLAGTVDALKNSLTHDGWLYRYGLDDGFGKPEVAFVLCTFWMVEALAILGRASEARALMDQVGKTLSPLGLIAEDYATGTRRMWGNFPQAYSHAGLIHGAFAASPRWLDLM
ncbi:MAG TPA: glycoside hydrolase family 15 protein [Polyangia bacterium]|nr:glycoside hydrolase family 15 protein [Polyangia bacterium]